MMHVVQLGIGCRDPMCMHCTHSMVMTRVTLADSSLLDLGPQCYLAQLWDPLQTDSEYSQTH
jgi:hypothetical protein